MEHVLLLAATDAPPLEMAVRVPLSILNFLELAVWGAWWVVLGQYLNSMKFTGKQIGSVYATMSIGSIIAPMFIGAIADRYFSSEVVMAVLHLVGAGLLFWMARIKSPRMFFVVALLYALAYSPTLPLSNSITFSHIPDAARDFPGIRVLGTIGWILANLALPLLLKRGQPVNNRPLLFGAGLSAVLGAYSLLSVLAPNAAYLLPHTPPKTDGNPFPFIDAIKLLGDPSFAVFFGVSLLITISLAFYYSFTAIFLEEKIGVRPASVAPLMTIGQWSEIVFMLALPWFLDSEILGVNLGMKGVLAVGMACWVIRYGLFSRGGPFPAIVLGIALHGICYDFFFAAGNIYVDQAAPEGVTASAQALFSVLTYGVGMYLGSEASGWLADWCKVTRTDPATNEPVTTMNWRKFWAIPCVGALVSLILFVVLFKG